MHKNVFLKWKNLLYYRIDFYFNFGYTVNSKYIKLEGKEEKMTYINAFEKIRERLNGVTSEKFTRDFAIQVNIVNKDCAGAFYVANLNGEFAVEPYDYRDNSAMITLMMGDFTKLIEGKMNIEKAVESGKMEIKGDTGAVAQLFGVVGAEKKAVEKKVTEKKAIEKKAAVKKASEKKETGKKEAVKKEAVKKETKPVKKAAAKKAK